MAFFFLTCSFGVLPFKYDKMLNLLISYHILKRTLDAVISTRFFVAHCFRQMGIYIYLTR